MGRLTHTVSGSIASIRTPSRVPIESLKLHFLPKQEGSGDPSPTNIRPITGWTGCNLWHGINNKLIPSPVTTTNLGVTWTVDTNGKVTFAGTPTSWSSVKVGDVYLDESKILSAKIFGNTENVCFTELYLYDSTNTQVAAISTGWAAYIEKTIDLSEYTTATKASIRVKRKTNNVPMYGCIYIVAGTKDNVDTVSVSWSDHGVEYGGYVDVAKGKLIAKYELLTDTWGNWGTAQDLGDGTILRYKKFTNPVYGNGITNHNTDYCNVAKYVYSNENGNPHYYIVGSSYNCRVYMPDDFSTDQVIQVIGKLITPIEYDLTPQQMQTFLDHNNFWSDANDVVEVTYPVTESRDILATRKRIMSQTWDMIPLKYQPVEYISAKDSNPYIDMGIQLTGECEMEVHFYNDKSEAFLFGARKSSTNQPYCNFNVESASADRSRFDYGNQKATATSGLPFAGYHDGEYIFKFHNRTASLERVSTGETLEKDYSEAIYVSYQNYNLFLFSVNTNGTPSLNTGTGELRIYSAKFWLGGQLVRDFVPCIRKADSKPGMYDRVSKTFFINVGSDEFAIPT